MIGDHIDNLRRWLDKWGDCGKIVFSDAWDVLFYGTPDEVAAKIPDSFVLFGAERNCWPDVYLKDAFPQIGTSHRFLNGGLLAARPSVLAEWLDFHARLHPAYHPAIMDQQWLNHRLLNKEISIDYMTELFYCMILEAGELQFEDGRPINTVNRSRPNFIHFNGKYDSTMFLWKQAQSQNLIHA